MTRPYRRVHLSHQHGQLSDVVIPLHFSSRLVGIAARGVDAILLRGRSVHTLWPRRPVAVVAIDELGTVVERQILRGRSVFRSSTATWILECDPELALPAVGEQLTVASSGNAGNAHHLRHADREPRRRKSAPG